jgi:hypothetical protein
MVEYSVLNAISISGTEISMLSGTSSLQTSTDHGVYSLLLDPVGAALTKGDYFIWKVYEKVLSGSTKRVVMSGIIGNAQSELLMIPAVMLRNGWDMTIQKVAGTDRTWYTSIRRTPGAISESYTQSALAVSSTELSLTGGTSSIQTRSTRGVFQCFIDVSDMVKADDYQFRVYETVEPAVQRQLYECRLMDLQAESYVSPMMSLVTGWDMTLDRIGGADITVDASIRRVV